VLEPQPSPTVTLFRTPEVLLGGRAAPWQLAVALHNPSIFSVLVMPEPEHILAARAGSLEPAPV